MRVHPFPVSLEPLESRIAPATVLVGAPDSFGADTNYDDAPTATTRGFVNTETGGDAISAALGPGVVGSADTFYIRLTKGDVLSVYNSSSSFQPLLIVNSGNIIAFFQDDPNAGPNNANEVALTEFVGLSLGKGASVEVKGTVFGDVVTNLNEHGKGTADDTLDMTGLVSTKQTLSGLTVGANILGSVYVGGNASNIAVLGNVNGVYAGTAANGHTFDFYPSAPGGNGTITFAPPAKAAGSSISKVRIVSMTDGLYAGGGGIGGKGGSLTSIQVTSDTDGYTLAAGLGGAGGAGKTSGGAGGTLSKIYISGVEDPTANSGTGIHILGGAGGAGSGTGKGGAGGAVKDVYVGYELNGVKLTSSGDLLRDSVDIRSGIGGAGKSGGVGGALTNLNVSIVTPENIVDPLNNEIGVIAGAGGNSTATGGKSGAGGSIKSLNLQNQDQQQFADILVQAGNAGTAVAGSTSGNGGSITTSLLLGSEVVLGAGNGQQGSKGGNGGSIASTNFLSLDQSELNALTVNAGTGGIGLTGNGGKGGNITTVKANASDLQFLTINGGTSGDGGLGTTKKGGAGGTVTSVGIIDIDLGNGFNGAALVRGGTGGQGKTGGGNGGNLTSVSLTSTDLQPTLAAGAGGATNGTGKGGKGGSINSGDISALGFIGGIEVSGTATAGVGGSGTGAGASGGPGGSISNVNLNVLNNVTIRAGNGGDGSVTPGAGGNVTSTAAFATDGSGIMTAGEAGLNGAKAAKGGSIIGTSSKLSGLRALDEITVTAGSGSGGGAGGSITFFTFGSTSDSLSPTPVGNIVVKAGNGSASAKSAGAGGSISNVDGSPTSGAGTTLSFVAGEGGGSAASTKSGAGGSIKSTTVTGVDDDQVLGNNVTIFFEAGNAGVSPNAATGGKGGSISDVSTQGLDPDAVVQRVAAGAGGAGTKKGGAGGSIEGVFVFDHDIGVRMGQVYGYTTMGGLFAGAGGAGPKVGVAGSVSNIVADGIAAIVAGRGAVPLAANVVENVTVGTNGANLLVYSEGDLVDVEDGGDPNYRGYDLVPYQTNNLIGFSVNPTAVDGNKFHFTDGNGNGTYELGEVPIDGLIVATTYKTTDTSLTPEAIFTGGVLFDFDNKI